MSWTEDQIIALSPDAASAKAGKDLAKPAKWVSLGADERALWGECQGSGSNPYRTQIDLGDTAFKCSCPSRKFPCKHGLGLFLMFVREKARFTEQQQPAWVQDWIDKRGAKAQKKAETTEKPVDEKAQAKRAEARTAKVTAGLQTLELWLKDLVRNGLIKLPERPDFWQTTAKQMSDAQASGVATLLGQFGQINYFKEGWQNESLQQVTRLYLLSEGFKNIDQLPENLQADLRGLIGWSIKQEELRAMEGIADRWWVLGRQTEEEQNLVVQRNWLYGEATGKYALVINFGVKNQPIDLTLVPGNAFQGEVVFYPGSYPLRAMVKSREENSKIEAATPAAAVADWLEGDAVYADAISVFPWVERFPLIVRNVILQPHEGQWILKDQQTAFRHVHEKFEQVWSLFAISGGHPVDVFVIREKDRVLPVGVWSEGKYLFF